MAPSGATVCVIIPAFNAQSTIGRAVGSALAQPEACEIIVVDDGSSDRTAAAAREADDGSGRLKVLSHPASKGPGAARNLALRATRAAWACPLDADDYFLAGRLGRMLAQASDCDFLGDDLHRVVEGQPAAPSRLLIGDRIALPRRLTFAEFARANISRRNMPRAELAFLKPLMRRDFLEAHGLAYDERLRLGEDFIFYATALALGARFKVVEACGYVAVERPDSLSGRHSGADLRNLLLADDVLARRPLGPEDAAALRAHRRHVAGKVALREVLDAKRARGLAGAGRVLAGAPATIPYVVSQIFHDKLQARRVRTATPAPLPQM